MSRAAVRYAKAMLSLAKEQNAADAVFAEMQQINATIAKSGDLKGLISSPLISDSIKKSSLEAVFSDAGVITKGLFGTLVSNKRIDKLQDVALSYISLYEEYKGIQVAKVTTAVALNDSLESAILSKVKELTGKEATLEVTVDESILGGFVLRVGDLQYNASIASQLASLKQSFQDNSFVSKL